MITERTYVILALADRHISALDALLAELPPHAQRRHVKPAGTAQRDADGDRCAACGALLGATYVDPFTGARSQSCSRCPNRVTTCYNAALVARVLAARARKGV